MIFVALLQYTLKNPTLTAPNHFPNLANSESSYAYDEDTGYIYQGLEKLIEYQFSTDRVPKKPFVPMAGSFHANTNRGKELL